MSSKYNQTIDAAEDAMDSAKQSAEQVVTSTRTKLMDGIHVLAGIVPLLQGFPPDRWLARVGLARRSSPFGMLGIFAAGLAVGAGIGVMFAPTSGEKTRTSLLGWMKREGKTLKGDAQELLDGADGQVDEVVRKAGEKADELSERSKGMAKRVERKLDRGVDAAEETIQHGFGAVKHGTEAVKNGATS